MKLASIKPNELAVVKDDPWVAGGEPLVRQGALPTDVSLLALIEKYASLKSPLAEALDKGDAKKIDVKLLKPAVERPSKIWAAAGTPNAVFRLTPEALVAMTGGRVIAIK